MDKCTESVFVYRRRLQWGEGDAAQIGYTSSQLDILLEAVDDWWRNVVGVDWFELNHVRKQGSPCVHVELDFHSPIRPGQEVFVQVLLDELGRSSMRFRLRVLDAEGQLCFSGVLVHVLIDHDALRSIPIPPPLEKPMREYMERTRDA